MYPESFRFEIVSFSVAEVFEPSDSGETAQLAAFDGIDELGQLEGFEPFDVDADPLLVSEAASATDQKEPPELVRWHGAETKNNDWMTLPSRFTDLALGAADGHRSPLSVLLKQALATDEPFVYQVVFTPKHDWTKEPNVTGATSGWEQRGCEARSSRRQQRLCSEHGRRSDASDTGRIRPSRSAGPSAGRTPAGSLPSTAGWDRAILNSRL
jgi:hypothetical protein